MSGGQKGRVGGAIIHGEGVNGRRSHEYRTWISMRQRCRQDPGYRDRGIRVCEQWAGSGSFPTFLADVGRAPTPAHTLDRWPDPCGGYEPGNVRWATTIEQRHNRRPDSKVGRPWLGKQRTAHAAAGNPSAKLTVEDVRAIRGATASGVRRAELARRFRVTRQSIANIVAGRTWKDGDGHAS